MNLLRLVLFMLLVTRLQAVAQEGTETASAAASSVAADNSASEKAAPKDKKLIQEANINLRTTVTGNQEQPRVLYILPWQSPLSPDLEIEMLSSQEEAVFGHLERDEVQRQLEFQAEALQAEMIKKRESKNKE